MTYEEISQSVAALIKKYDETDPYKLCKAMDIKLLYQPMGTAPNAVKGFFLEFKRIRTITINSDLPEVIQKIIVAHELCHATCHRTAGIQTFHDLSLFDHTSIMEKDANLFAAELLLDDQKVLEILNQDSSFFAAASTLMVPPELLDFKFRVMKWKGYKLVEPPINARSNFLLDIDVPNDENIYC